MYKIVKWSSDLNLDDFYLEAERKGFVNNSSQSAMIDCFKNEKDWCVWILFYNDIAVGSVASHSFPEMGENAYRICARTCVLSHLIPTPSLRTKNQIISHQHITGQFFIPVCIDWAPQNAELYITSNENSMGTQRLVHRIFCPAMEKSGQMKRIKDLAYRGTNQTVWQLFPDMFYKELNKSVRWGN